jgi:membrane protease YdiL (CAAX protease family)
MSRARTIISYFLIICALGWSLQLGALRATHGDWESDAAIPWLLVVMFTPALVALVFAWRIPALRGSLCWKPNLRMGWALILAVIVPTAIAFGTVAVCEGAGWGKAEWFEFTKGGVQVSGGRWLLGHGFQSWPMFAADVVLTGLVYSAFAAVFAAGEELGWRGFLQGQMAAQLGTIKGIAVLGLLWSFWHLPLLLSGFNYPEHPFLGALVLFPATLVSASFFLGWLMLRTGTFWPAALAHGATNSISEGVMSHLQMSAPHLWLDGVKLAFTVAFGGLFLTLIRKR